MRGFIHTALGFLVTGSDQDIVQVGTAPGSVPGFNSLIDIETVDPVTGTATDDQELLSGNLVALRSRDGIYLTAETPPGGGGLVLMSAYRGNDTARMGKDIYRIYNLSRGLGDPIAHGDSVFFVLATSPVPRLGELEWLTTGNPLGRLYFFSTTSAPGAAEVLRIFEERAHLTGFQLPAVIEQPQLRGGVQAQVTLSGPPDSTLPGGFGILVEGLGAPVTRTVVIVPADASVSTVELVLDGHGGDRGPCEGAFPARIRAESLIHPEEAFEEVVTVTPAPSPHLKLRLDHVTGGGCGCLPGIVGFLPWPEAPRTYFVQLERLESQFDTGPATDIAVSTEDPRIVNLAVYGDTADSGAPLSLSFNLGPYPAGERLGTCATLVANYSINNRPHTSRFGIRIVGDEIDIL